MSATTTVYVFSRDRINSYDTNGSFTAEIPRIKNPIAMTLMQATLPAAIHNIQFGRNTDLVFGYYDDSVLTNFFTAPVSVPAGRYDDIDSLIATLNDIFSRLVYGLTADPLIDHFIWDRGDFTSHITLRRIDLLDTHTFYLSFEETDLNEVLGFTELTDKMLNVIIGGVAGVFPFPRSTPASTYREFEGIAATQILVAEASYDHLGGIREVFVTLKEPDTLDGNTINTSTSDFLNRRTILAHIPVDYNEDKFVFAPRNSDERLWVQFSPDHEMLERIGLEIVAYSGTTHGWVILDFDQISSISYTFLVQHL